MSWWICVIAVIVAAVASGLWVSARKRAKVNYMLDALEDNEVNFRFRENGVEKGFNTTLNRMRDIFEREKLQIREQERYYALMLDRVSTGVLVCDSADGHVVYHNVAALELLGMNAIVSLGQLRIISPELSEAFFQAAAGKECNVSFTNDMSRRTVALRPSIAEIGGRALSIITFNDISSERSEIETESWTKLIRVLIHEIMNTVTPITSLSETLAQYADKMPRSELRSGLETINSSTNGLLKFVESYRSMMHVPAPVKKVVMLRELIDRVVRLHGAQTPHIEFRELSDDIILYVDEDQIAQILLNLIKNATAAGAKTVVICTEIDADESTVLTVSNDGSPIPAELHEQIFIPFFTTKKEGSGIGLSLSRQIMRLHNGSIALTRSDEKLTCFRLIFR